LSYNPTVLRLPPIDLVDPADDPYPDVATEAEHPFVPLRFQRLDPATALANGQAFYEHMDRRRSVRQFSPDPVPRELIDLAIRTAATAPSGAHHQPWKFVVVGDPDVRRAIRIGAEHEERINYDGGRIGAEWRSHLAPLGTHATKSFLDVAPWIVVVFEERYSVVADGERRHNYYVKESVGIACGLFITALHSMGLATLTHTPSPMAFLSKLLGRPENERPSILFPIGYPADGARVPDLDRKSYDEVTVEVTSDSIDIDVADLLV
jgi:iodotyrosine deiodinase